jgi:transcriptional regulator with XRE-family HTH domain
MARTNAQQKLGKKIRVLRTEADLTQEIVAEMTGLDRTYISGIERGVRNPSLKNIEKLAKALKVTISDLTDFQAKR